MRFVCALTAETALSGRTRTKNSLVASPFASDPLKKIPLFFFRPLFPPIFNSIFRSSLFRFSSPSSDPLSIKNTFFDPSLSFLFSDPLFPLSVLKKRSPLLLSSFPLNEQEPRLSFFISPILSAL